jgi:hypothetical protein
MMSAQQGFDPGSNPGQGVCPDVTKIKTIFESARAFAKIKIS